ncbi:MAG: DUF1573 domain-containing protein [Bacteroidales bacterium]|jgi:hypothetical protein|nr:DUF1573 domain-containing protein [Bacteroidales bacterium]
MKKLLLIIIIVTSTIINTISQPIISWEKTKHDFGTFKEETGLQTVVFNFTNTGNKPLVLTEVKPSCGCTATTYSQEPIQPGAKGYVNATFDPKNRPNEFIKNINVTSNTEKPTTILTIEGKVIPREKNIIDLYPREYGNLRLKTSALSFSKVLNTQIVKDSIEVINSGQEPINISFEDVPASISISANPTRLEGSPNGIGQKGYIIVQFDGSKKNDWGNISDRVSIILNGEKNNQNKISINAIIEEDFSHLSTDELANAPLIEFDKSEYDFGTIKQGDKATYNFTFKNSGKSDLVLRKIKTTCGCTATNPEKMIIKPGEVSHITVTFNSSGKQGAQQKTITVISNDPKKSNQNLIIKGKVEIN